MKKQPGLIKTESAKESLKTNDKDAIGRRKFIVPLYKELMAHPYSVPVAKEWYKAFRANYHPLAQESLDALIGK